MTEFSTCDRTLSPVVGLRSESDRASSQVGPIEFMDRDAWGTIVANHSDRTTFHHPKWLELIEEHYRFPLRILGLRHSDQWVAGLPWIRVPAWGRNRWISLPFSDHVPLVAESSTWGATYLQQLRQTNMESLEGGRQEASTEMIWRGCRHSSSLTDFEIPSVVSAIDTMVQHEIDLSLGWSAVRQRTSRTTWQNVVRGRDSGLSVETRTDKQAVDDFYPLQVMTRHKHGVPVQPRQFFNAVQKHLVDTGLAEWSFVRNKTGELLAGALMLTYGPTMICKYAASDPKRLKERPNDVLFAACLEGACERNFHRFDFGSSRWSDSGLRRFKRGWGGVETELGYWQVQGTPAFNNCQIPYWKQGLIRTAGFVIRQSPSVLCRGMGILLYRYSQ